MVIVLARVRAFPQGIQLSALTRPATSVAGKGRIASFRVAARNVMHHLPAQKSVIHLARIELQCSCDRSEFDNVHAPLADLDFRNEARRFPEPIGQLSLREPRFAAGGDEHGAQRTMLPTP